MIQLRKSFTCACGVVLFLAAGAEAATLTVTPTRASALYEVGEKITWSVHRDEAGVDKAHYVVRKDNGPTIAQGDLDLSKGDATIEVTLDQPAMLYVEVTPVRTPAGDKPEKPAVAAAAVSPTKIPALDERPADFDAFWAGKIKQLEAVPPNPKLTPVDAKVDGVDYSTIVMDHVNGTHVYGQLAKPNHEGKFPAIVIFQWASPPYPLDKSWVTNHAKNGWLALNIEPHNVLPTEPKEYYAALPDALKHYESTGNSDREKSYFVEMYLRDYRAVEYLASRPDWDGKTLVVMGTSMGGMQSLAVAGLNSKVTHLIVNEPAGCDVNAMLHDRHQGYPNFPSNDPKVAETGRYVDAANFASRIKATSLVAMGFIDTTAPPTGIWSAFNQITGPKEAVPMVDSPHNHLATPAQQKPYNVRSVEWLDAIAKTGKVEPRALDAHASATTAPTAEASVFDDHQNMLDQLGIKSLRAGPDPKDQSVFSEENANRFASTMPDALKFKDGTKVSKADQWPRRRAEIVEDFEREIYGRIPANVPKVTWEVKSCTPGKSGNVDLVTRQLIGHVDNSGFPALSVDIEASVTVPTSASAQRPAPVMLAYTFNFGPRPGAATRAGATRPASGPGGPPRPTGPSWQDQAIAHGWGYGTISPASIQPDNNQLRTGIIGLTNKGQPRKPDDWGALRAWAWGASKVIDCLEAHPEFGADSKRVGIEGLSRYGKAALVAEAFDERFAVGLIGSSGEGGAKLHRHIFGEAVETLASSYEYRWMAGNFIKYGASDPEMTPGDMPVDSYELIALCAPRPCFLSHGIPEKGDANWIDVHGSFMAGVLASEVYELLGKHGLGIKVDYLAAPMPPVNQLIGGELAWRQHDGGHDVTPTWPSFFEWASKLGSSDR